MIQPTNAQQLYPQPGGANAVSINIYNPQAYGSMPQQNAMQAPYQLSNSLYQMPVASAYQQQMQPQAYQQFMPVANPVVQQPALTAPAPQVMPESVMPAPQAIAQAPVVETPVVVEEKPVVVKQVSSKPVSNYKKLEAFNKRMR